VYRKISPDLKQRALYLLLEEGREIDRVTTALGVHFWAVVLQKNFMKCSPNPSLLLDEIGEWLALYHDQPISTTALHDNLKDLGFTYKRLKRIAAEQDNAYCADWLYNMTSNYSAE
jgi:hypothetical protein